MHNLTRGCRSVRRFRVLSWYSQGYSQGTLRVLSGYLPAGATPFRRFRVLSGILSGYSEGTYPRVPFRPSLQEALAPHAFVVPMVGAVLGEPSRGTEACPVREYPLSTL